MQSHEGVIDLLPALPDEWREGSFNGICARGAFELKFSWKDKTVTYVEILSKAGHPCRLRAGSLSSVTSNGKRVKVSKYPDGSIGFETKRGNVYKLGKI